MQNSSNNEHAILRDSMNGGNVFTSLPLEEQSAIATFIGQTTGQGIQPVSSISEQTRAKMIFKMENPSLDDEYESDSDGEMANLATTPPMMPMATGMSQISGLKPGKKTKGRVKIKMEFIENKLRRYTTFSKRKTGIMKKAYELSILTGTQVMLLVASETGHVYTFATRKLQPMITSESGKALIQTCLNSPDGGTKSPTQQHVMDQRMNPTGFEETELSYAVGDEDPLDLGMKQFSPTLAPQPEIINTGTSQLSASQFTLSTSNTPSPGGIQMTLPTVPAATYITANASDKQNVTTSSSSTNTKTANYTMQLPTTGLASMLQSGTPITIPVQQGTAQIPSAITQASHPTTVYRIPVQNQVLSINDKTYIMPVQSTIAPAMGTAMAAPANSTTQQLSIQSLNALNTIPPVNVNIIRAPVSSSTVAPQSAMTPNIVMYQTPQGIVYATPTAGSLADGSIFNFQQPATALSLPQPEQAAGATQQYITIPVPVSMAASQQLLQLAPPTGDAVTLELSQPTVAKKSRK